MGEFRRGDSLVRSSPLGDWDPTTQTFVPATSPAVPSGLSLRPSNIPAPLGEWDPVTGTLRPKVLPADAGVGQGAGGVPVDVAQPARSDGPFVGDATIAERSGWGGVVPPRDYGRGIEADFTPATATESAAWADANQGYHGPAYRGMYLDAVETAPIPGQSGLNGGLTGMEREGLANARAYLDAKYGREIQPFDAVAARQQDEESQIESAGRAADLKLMKLRAEDPMAFARQQAGMQPGAAEEAKLEARIQASRKISAALKPYYDQLDEIETARKKFQADPRYRVLSPEQRAAAEEAQFGKATEIIQQRMRDDMRGLDFAGGSRLNVPIDPRYSRG